MKRPQGPKRRDAREATFPKKLAVIGGVAVAALVAVVVVAVVVAGGGGAADEEALSAQLSAVGCTFETYPEQGREHVSSYDEEVEYNSFPPTSGPHHERPDIWGVYEDPVPMIGEVHNLEHGGVIIHYGNKVDAATRAELTAFYEASPNAMLLSPLPELGDNITLTAWTRLATCQRFDEAAFAAFRDTYRGNGPEGFRVDDLLPGT